MLIFVLRPPKLYGKYSNIDLLAGMFWAEDQEEYTDEFLEVLRTCQHLVELGGITNFAGTGLLQALAGNKLCEPQSIKLAQFLIDRGADVNELPPEDLRYYQMDDEDYSDFQVGTALQKATEANHQGMVKLLLSNGARMAESGSSGGLDATRKIFTS
jgi:ankyrin repeat protein